MTTIQRGRATATTRAPVANDSKLGTPRLSALTSYKPSAG